MTRIKSENAQGHTILKTTTTRKMNKLSIRQKAQSAVMTTMMKTLRHTLKTIHLNKQA